MIGEERMRRLQEEREWVAQIGDEVGYSWKRLHIVVDALEGLVQQPLGAQQKAKR